MEFRRPPTGGGKSSIWLARGGKRTYQLSTKHSEVNKGHRRGQKGQD